MESDFFNRRVQVRHY